ncbi:M4 family metallopeptidase [Frankia sp. CNm7]|uniref:Neutral metalloproteinase n=1 Tax=Frankia nepalensis TaxID=1836974 RepID=A0A937RUJ9_9ACTN|nr:M4 family metallopeptidase [Frankia nepalensis]MBL7497423.1 M4 family metallopeptidase [Frankia nepalensis]MBL7512741.1 M4 family metallopeptidase [Frankia nepalensis]MBL7522925.1 M4 family metallopeptidase [Frankia nepalensis]MBL7632156.1 M4 family metallopeptidase [Frankia nepalensis]
MSLEPRSTAPARHAPCAVPPNVLERIIRNGTTEQRDWALSTLSLDATARLTRTHNAAVALARPRRRPAPAPAAIGPRRTIADAEGREILPGVTVRTEGAAAVEDVAVNEAYDGLGATFDFFWSTYARNSIDDEGLPLLATVHYGDHYDNAFWDGQQMVFGDGDGELFNRFTVSLDIIGHELAHGVTEDEAGLAYLNQPGALNESVSDVFGSLVKQHKLDQKAEDADWLIGGGLLAPGVQGVALRSMKAPGTAFDDPVLGKDDQPDHMSRYVYTSADNGGVHINSGIPNKAFYNVATAFGGHAWEKAGKIWYETLRSPVLRTNASFRSFASITVTQARTLFGSDGAKTVQEGWRAVGVRV